VNGRTAVGKTIGDQMKTAVEGETGL